jgi:general stress protein YciG
MAHDHLNPSPESHDSQPRAEMASTTTKKSNRGFASMDRSKQREIASKGGRAAHEKGTAHQFSADEAREAGRKGGGAVSQDRQHMAEIGRIGGQARGRRQRAAAEQKTAGEPTESKPDVESSADDDSRQSHH